MFFLGFSQTLFDIFIYTVYNIFVRLHSVYGFIHTLHNVFFRSIGLGPIYTLFCFCHIHTMFVLYSYVVGVFVCFVCYILLICMWLFIILFYTLLVLYSVL